MSDFRETTNRIAAKIKARSQAVFANTASRALAGIQFGDPLTGSPGQPVRDSILLNSWQLQFESPTAALISTNVQWARQNEDGIARPGGGPYIQRSAVGGRHSVKLTIAGLDKIVEAETLKAVGNG